jgi:hypothetical protein
LDTADLIDQLRRMARLQAAGAQPHGEDDADELNAALTALYVRLRPIVKDLLDAIFDSGLVDAQIEPVHEDDDYTSALLFLDTPICVVGDWSSLPHPIPVVVKPLRDDDDDEGQEDGD